MEGASGRVCVHVLSAELSILGAVPDHFNYNKRNGAVRKSAKIINYASTNQTTVHSQEPEMHISSHRTMAIFCPARSSLATILAKRPRRWSRPSMTLTDEHTMVEQHTEQCNQNKIEEPP